MSEKEYIVTLNAGVDYEAFNEEMIATTGAGNIPNRTVDVANARPASQRNTHYSLTDAEAAALRNDSRVLDVQIPPQDRDDIEIGFNAIQTGDFDKSNSIGSDHINWGLSRCSNRDDPHGNPSVPLTPGPFPFTLTGQGVDVVIQDSGIQTSHIEFTNEYGVSRVQQIDWYAASGLSGTQSANHYRDYNGHGSHCAGTVAGRTQGWAREANIYSVKVSGLEGSGDSGTGISVTDCFDVIKEWHNRKPIDPKTGFKRPTVVNASWGYGATVSGDPTSITYQGNVLTPGSNGVPNNDNDVYTYFGIIPQYYNGGLSRRYNSRVASVDTDLEELIAAGVHVCVAAGNSFWYIDAAAGDNYNNSVVAGGITRYLSRGSSPYSTNAFMVGNIDISYQADGPWYEQKAESSCHGPGVDIYAPGTEIMSCTSTDKSGACDLTDGTDASYAVRNSPIGTGDTDRLMKISGTSMASPQVAGMVAGVLQANPGMTPAQMKTYIHNNATTDKLFVDSQTEATAASFTFPIPTANGTSAYTFTSTADRSGGNVVGDNPTITIYEGDTITLTNNTGSHPLYIKHTQGGGTGDTVTTPAATGQGSTNGDVSWTPTVPGVYYYQCSSHPAMNNTITVLPKIGWGDDDSITDSPNRILYSKLWSDPNSMGMKGPITRT